MGFAGRFVPEKGIDVLVRAARRAGIPLVIALDAPASYPLRENDDVEIIVTRGPDELASFYRKARVFVMPSIWFESFGIVAAEAMSHGVPVITGNCSAMPEVAGDGALLVDPVSVAEIRASMSKLYADRGLRTELSEKAGKQAGNFSWQRTADQTLVLIKRLAGS